ncbi:MAG: hypothetical protein ABW276_13245 [Casimicrobiaceae bacterium]
MTIDLEARITALPCWRGKVKLEPLHGGLSNTAFVLEDGRARCVARCGGDIPAHHAFRDRERAASVAAHAVGLSPELVWRSRASWSFGISAGAVSRKARKPSVATRPPIIQDRLQVAGNRSFIDRQGRNTEAGDLAGGFDDIGADVDSDSFDV